MRALLNSLGLTLWGSIAIVLAVGLAVVGYRVSLSMKGSPPTVSHSAAGVVSAPPAPFLSVEPSLESTTPAMHGQRFSRVIEPEMTAAEAALQAGHWQEALDNAQSAERKQGITVFDTKAINHVKAYAHLQLHDYSAALTDFERVLATGIATPEETATISKTVSALQARAESDRDALPRQETESQQQEVETPHQEAETSRGGELDLKLGELYYGFGDYQKAVDAITRGLRKHPVAHLDEAYVYLGLAEQKLDNIAEALRAFARLKGVPNVSPRILRLWTLYADTLADKALTTGSVKETPTPEQASLRQPQPNVRD
jgi:tetratricopeptide (TPR) repeat protein